MLQVRQGQARGRTVIGWLDSYHSFSFGDYYDPQFMGFSDLRVINEDWVKPGEGFGMHPHRDMEIVTYVLEGELAHKDSMGNGSVIQAGDVQRMTAGTGVFHSEFNHSPSQQVHLLQIWILPERKGLAPSYEQIPFHPDEKRGKLRLIGSRDGRDGSVVIHQDVNLYASILDPGMAVSYTVGAERAIWLQLARGEIRVNDQVLKAGDAVSITQQPQLEITGLASQSEFLLFDLRQ